MEAVTGRARPRLRAALREGAKVRFLELFFDLVFVLGFTQCTALMVEGGTWGFETAGYGVARHRVRHPEASA
jgi:low temperature requirement protein LtrA